MAVYKSKGIVLRSIRYGEADRILDLYTLDAGLVSAIAKGIRRTKSRFGARLEPLSCVDFVAYHGRTLDTVTQAETLRSFHSVREDLARFEAAAGMVGSVRALSGGDEADRRVFNLLYNALDTLEGSDAGFESIEASLQDGPRENVLRVVRSHVLAHAPGNTLVGRGIMGTRRPA